MSGRGTAARPLRIGIYASSYPAITGDGGIGTYTRHLAHALVARGHTVHVLSPGPATGVVQDGPVAVHLARDAYFPVVERVLPGLGAGWRIGNAMKLLEQHHQLDVVEFPNWEGIGLGYALRRSAPLVVRLHTSSLESQRIDDTPRTRIARWDVRRERWLARSADVLVTHSEAHRRQMADELDIAPERITVVPHGIPVEPGFRRPPRRGGDLEVISLGRLERRKGTLDLLHAIPEVLRDVPEAHFTLIGADRPHCPAGRTHARYIEDEFPAEVRARITLAGRLPDEEVDRRLQAADLFVAPSLYESFGLIYLEAMRWGTPVVGTEAGAIPEIVQDGETGVLVPPKEPRRLAGAIGALLRDEGLRRRLGEAGRRRVEEHYTIDRAARRVADLYARAIGAR